MSTKYLGKFADIHDTIRGKSLDIPTSGYMVEAQVHPFHSKTRE